MSEKDCVFCKIARGEIFSEKVYEDSDVLAFLDIAPNNPGHTLLIPKRHSENLYDMDDHSLAAVMRAAQKIALAVKEGARADGINLAMNNEEAAGQVIFHPHLHIIPRFKEDGYHHWPKITYKEGEAAEVAARIRAAMK